MIDVAILTEERYLKPKSKSQYIQNILTEDCLVLLELESLNISCQRVAWDGSFKADEFRHVLFRTTWNYFDQLDLFRVFLQHCRKSTILINDYQQIYWNLNKKYLINLRDCGVNIVPTKIIQKGQKTTLTSICQSNSWEDIIIKPCVSAAAWQTYHIEAAQILDSEKLFQRLSLAQDMIVQEFQSNITTSGEISLMMIGGVYTHAVLKRAKQGDFRVQDDYGGSVAAYLPKADEIKFANQILEALPFKPIYARVDIMIDNSGNLALSELELIEPEMWFRLYPKAAKLLAQSIKKRVF